MYAALRHQQLVLARTEAYKHWHSPKPTYRCPHCSHEVVLIIAEAKTPYFQHLNLKGSGGEKNEHALGKRAVKAALTAAGWPAQLEVPLANGQIRADVLASPKLAFEIQCAPLSQTEFSHRHHCYQQVQIMDVWLVGQRHFLGTKIKKTQVIFLRFNKRWHWYYLELDVKRNILRLQYNLQQTAWQQRLCRQQQEFALDELGLQALWQFHPILRSYQAQPKAEYFYLQKQLTQKTKLGLELGEYLYLRKQTSADLPAAAFSSWQVPGANYDWTLLDLD
ncbi:MAG: competence protein [Lactobacillus sp.]|nr:competence protein [Lactobacillus sp.]MCH3906618.1 competence protein [Lactobacillus sp.]MCH3989746.1 competence protein [Lactobacillus sp.]MCH4068088.1 competence protein [Lactobacillus sp.]MCI1303956.1 competence protein [Lactobacillus sp.]